MIACLETARSFLQWHSPKLQEEPAPKEAPSLTEAMKTRVFALEKESVVENMYTLWKFYVCVIVFFSNIWLLCCLPSLLSVIFEVVNCQLVVFCIPVGGIVAH